MKRYYLNSWVAKVLLMFTTCHTITIGFFVFSKNKSITKVVKNHETIHTMQWLEVTMLAGLIFVLLDIIIGVNLTYLSPIAYYALYGFEWLLRVSLYKSYKLAYLALSFEREAYENEEDSNYLLNRPLFSWLKYIYG